MTFAFYSIRIEVSVQTIGSAQGGYILIKLDEWNTCLKFDILVGWENLELMASEIKYFAPSFHPSRALLSNFDVL